MKTKTDSNQTHSNETYKLFLIFKVIAIRINPTLNRYFKRKISINETRGQEQNQLFLYKFIDEKMGKGGKYYRNPNPRNQVL